MVESRMVAGEKVEQAGAVSELGFVRPLAVRLTAKLLTAAVEFFSAPPAETWAEKLALDTENRAKSTSNPWNLECSIRPDVGAARFTPTARRAPLAFGNLAY